MPRLFAEVERPLCGPGSAAGSQAAPARRRRCWELLLAAFLVSCNAPAPPVETVALTADREERQQDGSALTPGTQSMNRYHSVIQGFDQIDVIPQDGYRTLGFQLHGKESGRLYVEQLATRFLTPLVPYRPPAGSLDEFDLANLFLGEFARSGVELSYQTGNSEVGYFRGSDELFDGEDAEEYFLVGGAISPNPRVRPKRFSVVNNCLAAGLWEVSAGDSVGEIFHGWFNLPEAVYFAMIRQVNGVSASDETLRSALTYRPDLSNVRLDLARLRDVGAPLLTADARPAADKTMAGYSSQDSRRKVQRGYYEVRRGEAKLAATRLDELQPGDRFALRAFVPPGIYSLNERKAVDFDPAWSAVEIRAVEPKTRYPGQEALGSDRLGHVEIWLFSLDRQRALVLGNLPVALLVVQEDLALPAFGVGVNEPSEPIERRLLRYRSGPAPTFAYLAERRGEEWWLVNNHEVGWEQVFLRPFERDGSLFLRLTVVSYERIVDLLELEVPLSGELAERIREASRDYRPPLYRTYRDDNVL